jgi:hypothetical protein
VSAPWTARPIWRATSPPCSTSTRQPREAATGQPHDELRRRRRLRRDLFALQLREHEIHRGLALLVQRLAHGRQRRRREARVLDVVEADDRHVRRHLKVTLLQRGDRAQRHVVVRGRESVELDLAFVDQQLDGRLAR